MSTFVFSRRYLQKQLDALSATLSHDQREALARRLNTPGEQRLPAMWELVFLAALAAKTQLRHEFKLRSGKRPDFAFTIRGASAKLDVVGDITTVSDAGLDEQNPVETLWREIYRLAERHGLSANHFSFDVRGGDVGKLGKKRIQLHLPKRSDLLRIIRDEVEPFILALSASGKTIDVYQYNKNGVAFRIDYDQSQRFAGGGYPSYSDIISKTNNPIYKALKPKAGQLSGAAESALRMIILCDGGCAVISRSPNAGSYRSVSVREIAAEFLRQHSSIDIVLLVKVMTERPIFGGGLRSGHTLKCEVVGGKSLSRFAEPTIKSLVEILSAAVDSLPTPVLAPKNAAARCEETGVGPDNIGGYELADDRISISSRALHRLLAGEITQERFFSAHGWNTPGPGSWPNPFLRHYLAGRMVIGAEVKYGDDQDDDWIALEFGQPDAAARSFMVRPAKRGKLRRAFGSALEWLKSLKSR